MNKSWLEGERERDGGKGVIERKSKGFKCSQRESVRWREWARKVVKEGGERHIEREKDRERGRE